MLLSSDMFYIVHAQVKSLDLLHVVLKAVAPCAALKSFVIILQTQGCDVHSGFFTLSSLPAFHKYLEQGFSKL